MAKLGTIFSLWRRRKPDAELPLRVFREFEAGVNLIEDHDQIARNFLGKIREVCPTPKLILLIHDPATGRFVPAAWSGASEDEIRTAALPRDSRLAKWLKVNETHLEFVRQSGVLDYLSTGEKSLFQDLKTAVAFPLMAMNRLIGILLVGERTYGAKFTRLETTFISSLLPQAGVALENALLFKEQRDRLRRMSRADKLATVGELAAGAAHEIRNPLTAIRSSLQYLEGKIEDENARSIVRASIEETNRINEIVSALLSFSRPSDIVRERHDLRETLADSIELIAIQARTQKTEIRRIFPDDPLPLRGDKAQLKQLFLNLFLNAVQAMPGGGTLTVEALCRGGSQAVVSVADTGEGIPEESIERIFDPFFTTKKGGTGLGLSICYNIVKSHGGEIEVQSKPGQGTTILIRLPAG